MKLTNIIKLLRVECGLTQRNIAKSIGISLMGFQNIENYKADPSTLTALKILYFFKEYYTDLSFESIFKIEE